MSGRIVVLTGGVGGAKLVLGLQELGLGKSVTAVVNTGDDFQHLGLRVCPDLDTLLYTLAGRVHPGQGWGAADESFAFLETVRSLGGEDWFLMGDRDLALHVLRTQAIRSGKSLTEAMRGFARAWGVDVDLLPMSEDEAQTQIVTAGAILPFQTYFVAQRCVPVVCSVDLTQARAAAALPDVLAALSDADARAILIAPSNPYLSIDPILAVPGIAAALHAAKVPVVAVSPLVGGTAVKGPTAKIMQELDREISHRAIAAHYDGMIDAILVDDEVPAGYAGAVIPTLMTCRDDRVRVAEAALRLAATL